MSRLMLGPLVVVLLVVAGCSQESVPPDQPEAPADKPATEAAIAGTPYQDFVVAAPIRHENLTIFPICSKTPKNEDRFITLDEGLAAGTVTITEVGSEQTAANAPAEQVEQAENEAPQFDDDDLFGAPAAPLPPDPQQSEAQQAEPQADQAPSPPEPQEIEPEQTELQQTTDNPFAEEDPFGTGPEVNRLLVLNRSDKPLYLMPGEVISGGEQDRTIGQEIVIQPGPKPVPIDAFCVEHGRWHGRDMGESVALLATIQSVGGAVAAPDAARVPDSVSLKVSSGERLAAGSETAAARAGDTPDAPSVISVIPVIEGNDQQAAQERIARVAEEANEGKFVASPGQLSKAARVAVQDPKDQGKVWQEVGKLNAKTGNELESGNFSGNYGSEDIAARLKPYLDAMQQQVAGQPQVVGVVVAVNGKVEVVDLFESTPLFTKLWPKLLRSYALDAVAAAEEEGAKKPCAVDDCIAFLKKLDGAPAGEVEIEGGLAQVKRESEHLISFSVLDSAAAPAEATGGVGGMPGFGTGGGLGGGGVHTGGFAH